MPSRNEIFDGLRRDWYGPERADAEISAQHNGLRRISGLVDKALIRVVPKTILALERLRSEWTDIVGPDNARYSTPVFVRDNILHIEIANPVCRMALDTVSMKEGIMRRIHLICGANFCTSIRFIPRGRVAFTARKKNGTPENDHA